jgi:membrane-associated phospholipid phosphatase
MMMVNVLLGRVYFCCHYFADTLVGVALGYVSTMLICGTITLFGL